METLLMNCKSHLYKVIHNRILESIITILKKLINNSRGKYKRNECLINVCKSDTDLS